MKFSNIAIFATGALAAKPIFMEPTLVERQSASQIVSDIGTISASAAALDSAIKSFAGASDAAALVSASQNIVSAINKAESDSAAVSSLSDTDATGLIDPINALAAIVKTTVSDLTGKKSQFAALGLCGSVLSQVQAQQSAATKFQNTLISKVPQYLQSTAQSLAAPITASLQSAATAFSSCPASTASSSGSTGTTTAPSTGTTTAPSTTTSAPGSFTSTCTTSTGSFTSIATPPTNGTTPTVPSTPTPTVIPNTNSGVKQVAGFGGLVLAAVAAMAL